MRWLKKLRWFGLRHYCPLCCSPLRTFQPFGKPPRPGAKCPVCGSLERHRFAWIFLKRCTDLLEPTPKKMLHIAPEPALSTAFAALPSCDYLSGDISMPSAMVRLDVTDIGYPDDSFDFIFCSHVLEHVPDDRRAIRELYRVTRKGGRAALQIPITAERTVEDPSATSPQERERLFGQHDHVRRCGPDYIHRFEEAGFRAERFDSSQLIDEAASTRMGIRPHDSIFFCTK